MFFALEDVAIYLEEDFSEVEKIELPLLIDGKKKTVKNATFDIEIGQKKEMLSLFNKALLKARHFKK